MLFFFFFFFFFSSRRRHTRCSRDWSSDVCSSDLPPKCARCATPSLVGNSASMSETATRNVTSHLAAIGAGKRSEERRVGKECRCGGWADDEKEKKRRTDWNMRVKTLKIA